MKLAILTSLLFVTSLTSVKAKVSLVPLDTEYGKWITTTNTNQAKMIDQMLEKYPASQRDMMKKMMKKMMPKKSAMDNMKQEQCITKDSYKDMERKLKEALGKGNANKCAFKVTKSTSKIFSATIDCGAVKSNVMTKVINSKRNESTIVTNIPSMGKQEIKTVSVWKSSKCN
jgi:hypothetical protein